MSESLKNRLTEIEKEELLDAKAEARIKIRELSSAELAMVSGGAGTLECPNCHYVSNTRFSLCPECGYGLVVGGAKIKTADAREDVSERFADVKALSADIDGWD